MLSKRQAEYVLWARAGKGSTDIDAICTVKVQTTNLRLTWRGAPHLGLIVYRVYTESQRYEMLHFLLSIRI